MQCPRRVVRAPSLSLGFTESTTQRRRREEEMASPASKSRQAGTASASRMHAHPCRARDQSPRCSCAKRGGQGVEHVRRFSRRWSHHRAPQDPRHHGDNIRWGWGRVHAARAEGTRERKGGEDRVRMIFALPPPPDTRKLPLSVLSPPLCGFESVRHKRLTKRGWLCQGKAFQKKYKTHDAVSRRHSQWRLKVRAERDVKSIALVQLVAAVEASNCQQQAVGCMGSRKENATTYQEKTPTKYKPPSTI